MLDLLFYFYRDSRYFICLKFFLNFNVGENLVDNNVIIVDPTAVSFALCMPPDNIMAGILYLPKTKTEIRWIRWGEI